MRDTLKLVYNASVMVYKLEVIVTDVHINQTQFGTDTFVNVMKGILKLMGNVNKILKHLVQIHPHLVQ